MKVVQINAICGTGSTGKICVEISKALNNSAIENYILYCAGESNYPQAIQCSGRLQKLEALKSRILGNYGFNSIAATRKIIKELDRIKLDAVHLHNLHGHNCNLKILFDYLRNNKIRVLWTFHDCWAFTAYCPHFTMAECDQWKTGCSLCPQRRNYSWFFDRSSELYKRKKELFSGLDLTIVTPSQWLADLVKQSFLKDHPVMVINNGIDLSVFRPTLSDFRQRYGISDDKFILLGVAFDWGICKGLDVFIELAKRFSQEQYQIVLVGTNDKIDKQLPDSIISIHRTQNQQELAEIYSAADLFVNPTREDNYPTVNMESIACGTPVLTFKTGGSPECLDETCGSVVPCDDIDALEKEIRRICTEKPFLKEACLRKAKDYDQINKFNEYILLMKSGNE